MEEEVNAEQKSRLPPSPKMSGTWCIESLRHSKHLISCTVKILYETYTTRQVMRVKLSVLSVPILPTGFCREDF